MLGISNSFLGVKIDKDGQNPEPKIVYSFNPLNLFITALTIATAIAGILAGFKQNQRAAKFYYYGLAIVIVVNISSLIMSTFLSGLFAMREEGAASVAGIFFLAAVSLVCGLGIGACCNLPCFACLFCGKRYSDALIELQTSSAPNSTVVVPPVQDVPFTQVELPPYTATPSVPATSSPVVVPTVYTQSPTQQQQYYPSMQPNDQHV